MLRKQAVFDRETFLTLPDLPPRLKLWGARLRSEGSLLLSDVPSVHAKMAKYALLTAARAEVPDHTAHAEGSDTTPVRNAPCFAV